MGNPLRPPTGLHANAATGVLRDFASVNSLFCTSRYMEFGVFYPYSTLYPTASCPYGMNWAQGGVGTPTLNLAASSFQFATGTTTNDSISIGLSEIPADAAGIDLVTQTSTKGWGFYVDARTRTTSGNYGHVGGFIAGTTAIQPGTADPLTAVVLCGYRDDATTLSLLVNNVAVYTTPSTTGGSGFRQIGASYVGEVLTMWYGGSVVYKALRPAKDFNCCPTGLALFGLLTTTLENVAKVLAIKKIAVAWEI